MATRRAGARDPIGGPLRFRALRDGPPREVHAGHVSVRLVVCPRCDGCARLVRRSQGRPGAAHERLHCPACGAIQDSPAHVRLWLRVPCCGHVLWATGAEHLAFLEDYIKSPLRERLRRCWPDRELLARLPRWLLLARHREAVLRALGRLKQMLPVD